VQSLKVENRKLIAEEKEDLKYFFLRMNELRHNKTFIEMSGDDIFSLKIESLSRREKKRKINCNLTKTSQSPEIDSTIYHIYVCCLRIELLLFSSSCA
jgi:hypothetical protein